MIYFDAAYLVRLYFRDQGWEQVRKLAGSGQVVSSAHGYAETVAAIHRKMREGFLSAENYREVLHEFDANSEAGAIRWLPLSMIVMGRLLKVYQKLPSTLPLRAGDALHLSCAQVNGLKTVYSNDKTLLNASPYFGLQGVNVISSP